MKRPSGHLKPGDLFGQRYKIRRELGKGAMGVVFEAEDTRLERAVALKFLLPTGMFSDEGNQRFVREARAAAALTHPNIATVFEYDEWNGERYISMELVEGETLSALLKRGPLSLDWAIEFTVAIADALSLAHRKGIIHRDIKPGNIMVVSSEDAPSRCQVKVMDFGLAKIKKSLQQTEAGMVLGTLAYMSPEQAQGLDVDPRSDIFSLGAVFYEMLAGKCPFGGESEASVLYSLVNQVPRPLAEYRKEVSGSLQGIVFRCLAKTPDSRYQSMTELLADLADYQYNPQTLAAKTSPGKKSIAVLPFRDISPGRENGHLSDGMTEELITTLARNVDLRVIARTSIMPYKEGLKEVREIGRELGISNILEGSVRRLNDKLRITAQLVDAEDGSTIWAENYDGGMNEIFAFQEAVAKKVTAALDIRLSGKKPDAAPLSPQRVKAYELYLQGKFLQDVPTLPNLDRSVQVLERAVHLDPEYAEALGCLSSAFLWYLDTGLRPDPQYARKAEETARKALEINPGQAEALCTVANLTMKKASVEEAFKLYGLVLEASPNHRDARFWRAVLLLLSSYFEEALVEADLLLSTDPFWPMAHWLHSTVRLHQGMFDAAIAEYEQVVAEVPSKMVWLALVYRYSGNMDKAWTMARKVKTLEPEGYLWKSAFAFLEGAEGRDILKYIDEEIKSSGWNFHLVCYWVASFYALAGEVEEAFRWLGQAVQLGNRNYRWFAIDPNLEKIRKDSRFPGFVEEAKKAAARLLTSPEIQ
jgi:serine/threonine protein kinase/tetratricopeptide (TPR) repeat protein